MKTENNIAILTWGILIGFAMGIIFGMWSPQSNGDAWTDPACKGPIWYCFVYSWQTVVAGIAATFTALFGAVIAWKSAQKQVKAATRIPVSLRKNELLREQMKLEQILKRIDMYESSSNQIIEHMNNTQSCQDRDFLQFVIDLQNIACPSASILENMAMTYSMPALRAELLNAARHVGNLNKNRTDLDRILRSNEKIMANAEKLDRLRIKIASDAAAVSASIQAVKTAIGIDFKLYKSEDKLLEITLKEIASFTEGKQS